MSENDILKWVKNGFGRSLTFREF